MKFYDYKNFKEKTMCLQSNKYYSPYLFLYFNIEEINCYKNK